MTFDMIPIHEVARDFGITPQAAKLFALRRGRTVHKVGSRNFITLNTLELLTAERERDCPTVPRRPKGWWGSKQVCDLLGVAPNTLTNMTRRGDLHPVRVGRVHFYDPQEVQHLARLRRPAPPGWVSLVEVSRRLGVSRTSPLRTAYSLGLEVRFYRTAEGQAGHDQAHVREEDVPVIAGRLTLPLSYPGRLTSAELAAVCGIAPTKGPNWIRSGLPHVRCRRGYAWIDPVDALLWFDDHPVAKVRAHAGKLRAYLAQQQPGRAA